MTTEQITEKEDEGRDLKEEGDRIFRDYYAVNPPFGYVGIEIDGETGEM